MSALVSYELTGAVASIAMDDGKVNVLSAGLQAALHDALDQAERDRAVVLLSGNDRVFSAGFDLTTLRAGGAAAASMIVGGFELAYRVLSFPRPVVIACTGHAVAMGAFLLLSGDHRIGVAGGAHRIVTNEVAIGLTMPSAAIAICRQRLTPAHFSRAVLTAEPFTPDSAADAGFLDRVVPAGDLLDVAYRTATELCALDLDAHAATKLRARNGDLLALRAGIDADKAEFAA